jgi:GMP synthase-like glutamine amidotransferase
MRILSVIHGHEARTELFAPAIAAAGHEVEEWSFVWDMPPAHPLESYDAVMVFGGAMHADQERTHPWILPELRWLEQLLSDGTPTLGICLGAQLLSRAAGSWVGPLEGGPEIGFVAVERIASDPVFDALPERFDALQWHHYTYGLPSGAVETHRSARATQGFRLGDACWAVQFHPEVTAQQLEGWLHDPDDPPVGRDPEELRAEIAAGIGRWNELGIALCNAFLRAAEHRLARAA